MKPDDHWFSSYFAQDHAGNLVDILIKISEVTLKEPKAVIVKSKEGVTK